MRWLVWESVYNARHAVGMHRIKSWGAICAGRCAPPRDLASHPLVIEAGGYVAIWGVPHGDAACDEVRKVELLACPGTVAGSVRLRELSK